MEIQDLIQKLKEQGMTKWKISKEVHVSWQTVHMWDRGVFSPSSEKMEKLRQMVGGE